MTLTTVLLLAAGTYALRLAGPLLRTRTRVPETAGTLLADAAAVLLCALVAVAALTQDGAFAGWARPAGVLAGATLAVLRAPFLLTVLTAATTTALLRLCGVP